MVGMNLFESLSRGNGMIVLYLFKTSNFHSLGIDLMNFSLKLSKKPLSLISFPLILEWKFEVLRNREDNECFLILILFSPNSQTSEWKNILKLFVSFISNLIFIIIKKKELVNSWPHSPCILVGGGSDIWLELELIGKFWYELDPYLQTNRLRCCFGSFEFLICIQNGFSV